jgi:hypothetical protein
MDFIGGHAVAQRGIYEALAASRRWPSSFAQTQWWQTNVGHRLPAQYARGQAGGDQSLSWSAVMGNLYAQKLAKPVIVSQAALRQFLKSVTRIL